MLRRLFLWLFFRVLKTKQRCSQIAKLQFSGKIHISIYKRKEVSPFPIDDYKAAWISQDIMTNNHEAQMYERSLITPNISTQAELVGAKYNWFLYPLHTQPP